MAKTRAGRTSGQLTQSLIVRLDDSSKTMLVEAARRRGVSVSAYVREVTVAQASLELEASRAKTITLTASEQLAFWTALDRPVTLSPAQRRLGAMMRGDAIVGETAGKAGRTRKRKRDA